MKNSPFTCKGVTTYTSLGSQQNLLDTLLDVAGVDFAGVQELGIGFLEN